MFKKLHQKIKKSYMGARRLPPASCAAPPRCRPAALPASPPLPFAAANPPCPLPARRACRLMPAELVSAPVDRRRGARDAAADARRVAAQYRQDRLLSLVSELRSPLRRQVFIPASTATDTTCPCLFIQQLHVACCLVFVEASMQRESATSKR